MNRNTTRLCRPAGRFLWVLVMAGLCGTAIAGGVSPKDQDSNVSFPNAKPTVLLHGLFGKGATIMGGSYFNGLSTWIRTATGTLPLMPDLGKGSLEDSYKIAKALIDLTCKDQPTCRVHLVGHSRGGLVGRLLVERMPERIQSLTMVGTPHRGSFLADAIVNDPKVRMGFNVLAGGNLAGWDQQIQELTPAAMKVFNRAHPMGVESDQGQNGICDTADKDAEPTGDYVVPKSVLGTDKEKYWVRMFTIASVRDGSEQEMEQARLDNGNDASYGVFRDSAAYGSKDPRFNARSDGVTPLCSTVFALDPELEGLWSHRPGWLLKALDHGDQMQQLAAMAPARGIEAVIKTLANQHAREVSAPRP